MNVASAITAAPAPQATSARAADGDYKTKGVGHDVKDSDGDYKPTKPAPAAVATPSTSPAATSSAAVQSALVGLQKGGA